jgi:DNA-binding MarR family transcriptional regulator
MASISTSPLIALDDALFDIQRLARRPGYRAQLLARLGNRVEFSTVRVLRAVERAGATPPGIGDIAERLMVDPSTASRFVEQQVEAGYLTRRRHPDDGRPSQLVLTEAGRALLDEVTAARRDLLAEVTADWDHDDLERLSHLLALLREGFDELESRP